MSAAGQQQPAVVIEPIEDLHVGFVSQPPVDEIRLPHLIRLRRLKTDVAASGALAGLRDYQPGVMQNPPDRRGRQDPKLLPLEVPADRLRAGIQPVRGQRSTQLEHSLTDLWRGRSGGPFRPSRTRLDSVQATGPTASQKAMKVPAGEPILGSGSSDGHLVGYDLENSNTGSRHARQCGVAPDAVPV